MLCKKCKTAVSDADTVCGFCGTKITRNKNKIVLTGVFIGIVVLLVAYLLYVNSQKTLENPPPAAIIQDEPTVPSGEEPLPTPAPVVIEPDDGEEPIPSSAPHTEKTREEVDEMLRQIVAAANEFYGDYSPSVAYISKNGYWFDVPGNAYVKMDEIVDLTDLDEVYAQETILFLYLRPSDLKGSPNVEVKDGESLTIFVAYEMEDGFVVVSNNNGGGMLTRPELHKVLEKYVSKHGSIRRFSAGSQEYENIITEIQKKNDTTTALDVRYMAGDDKYAVAVVSQAGRPGAVEEYVFMNRNGYWVMEIANIESLERFRVDVNRILPDLNPSLLPRYDLSGYTYQMRSNFAEIINAMKSEGMITDKDGAATFASGTIEFVYLEFQSGRRFVGHLNGQDVWEMFDIQSYDEGVAILRGVAKNPPLFVMKQFE